MDSIPEGSHKTLANTIIIIIGGESSTTFGGSPSLN